MTASALVAVPHPVEDVPPKDSVFCVPPDRELLGYWDRVEDRLAKVRNCIDISGSRRRPELFAPELDPGLLLRQADLPEITVPWLDGRTIRYEFASRLDYPGITSRRFFPAQARRPRFPPLHDGIPSTSLSIAASTSPTAIVTARQDRHHPSRPDDLAALQPTNPRRRRRQRGRSADHTTFQHAGVLNAAAVTPMEVPLTTGQGITTSNQTLTLAGPQRPGDIALHRP